MELLVIAAALLLVVLRAALRHPAHAAATLTAMAIPFATSPLLLDSAVPGEIGLTASTLVFVIAIAIGMRWEQLGAPPHRVRDWLIVSIGAAIGLMVGSFIVVFFGIFGSLIGLYAMATAACIWLALRFAISGGRKLAAWREGPT